MKGNAGRKRAHTLSLLPSDLNSGCSNWQRILICRFKAQKQHRTINNACYNANTNKHIQVSASHLGHVCVCGMNVLWHGQAVNLGHLNDWCTLSYYLISHGDQWMAAMAGVKRAARPCHRLLGLTLGWVWKMVDKKRGERDLEVVCSRGWGEMEWGSRFVHVFT